MSTPQAKTLSFGALFALVVGSMIGSGIFALPAAFARATGVVGASIAWLIAGGGMLMLAFTFLILSRRRPDLDSGIYAYARAGFGGYAGFMSAIGYWIGCCLADVACLVLIKATIGQFVPAFGDGTTALAIVSASLLLWGVHLLILRGVREAAALNTIATIAKLVPIATFIFVVIVGFRRDVFAANLWGGDEATFSGVAGQVRATLLVTVFAFVGIEGASVYSRYARRREDVGLATVLGFFGVLCLLIMVTMFSYGILLRPELAAQPTPAMAGVMEAVVGPWGRVFVSVGLLISVLGNYLSWSLLAAEVLHSAARDGTVPAALARENARGAPAAALWLTNSLIQAFLLVTWFAEYAFLLALKMTGAMTLVPYLLVGAYGVKLAWTGETFAADESAARRRALLCTVLATAYAAAMLTFGGTRYLLFTALLYVPATILFVLARREEGKAVFTRGERMVFVLLCVAAAIALYGLATGALTV
ncbi:basic amino acid/polyamine antiporter [Lysobacter sp. MMG2]|uniref:basic amino acid/polyamine antiporter n=1 Tax=Lysobacter sp. MMG2 TaxID=2801338 RepID=UPI001C20F9CD|nr:basic amino acid/polyamine antiporter [Lysobacter sp. MMG2]MBU8976495.1 basic amino acid/polyamine antiporter [Lysobacter sp. MMG2]